MKNKSFIKCFLVAFLLTPHLGISYPWVFFKDTKRKNYLEFDLHSSFFLENRYSVFTGGKLEYHNSKIDIDIDYRYSLLEKKHYSRFGEISVILPLIQDQLNMILGFRDFVWNESDRYWNLGLWQPRYLLDIFRPLQTSLPGLYFDYLTSSNITLTLYLSYFYLPDVIIYPEIKNGVITSKNPYFSNPNLRDVKWDVDKLRSFEFLSFLQPMMAFQIYHQLPYSEIFLSYAYKPKNQLQFFVHSEGISLSESDSSKITIKGLDYDTVRHHLFTIESEMYLDNNLSVFASLFYERPEKLKARENWVSDGFEPHLTTSFLIYFKEEIKKVEKTVFTLGYIKNFESKNKLESSNIITEDLEVVFGTGVNWKHALSWSMEYWTASLFNGFQLNFRLNYALDNQIYNTILDTSFYITPSFQAYVSGDALFRFSDRAIKSGTSSISKYKNLSRLLLGIKYVF